MLTLGEFVRQHRLARDLSVEALARRVDVSGSTISRIESGKTQMPDKELLNRIADALGVERSELHWRAGYRTEDEEVAASRLGPQDLILVALRNYGFDDQDARKWLAVIETAAPKARPEFAMNALPRERIAV